MSIDDLINSALEGRGGILDGSSLFAVVGDPKTQEMFVLNLDDFLMENLRHFTTGNYTDTTLLGIYKTEEEARNCIQSIRDTKQHAPNLVGANEWYILLGKVEENELFILPFIEYLAGYLQLFLFKSASGIIALSIGDKKEAMEDTMDFFNLYIKKN